MRTSRSITAGSACILAAGALLAAAALDDPARLFRARTIELEGEPRQLVVGHFDGDGFADLALTVLDEGAGPWFRRLSVRLGDGEGDFTTAWNRLIPLGFYLGIEPKLDAGRLDGDDCLDLVYSRGDWGVVTRLGNCAGGIGPALQSNIVGSGSTVDVTLAAVNDDAFLDAVTFVEDWAGYIDLGWGDGDGTFTAAGCAAGHAGVHTAELAVGDINGDTFPDALFATSTGVRWAAGQPGGTIGAGCGGPTPILDPDPTRDLALALIDDDDVLDLLTTHPTDHRLELRFGVGDGTFDPPVALPTERRPEFLHVADVNDDGHLDVCTGHGVGSLISILFGDGAGSFPRRLAVPAGLRPDRLVSADVDADGDTDLIVADSGDHTLTVLLNRRIP